MVKQLDDLLPDHIGVPLWMAAQAWKERFHAAMVEAGHDWFAEGRVNLLSHLNPGGDRQADLVRKSGLSKQAVQQFVDTLVTAGAVERVTDPDDKRGRIVRFTEKGLAAQRDGTRLKLAIDAEWRAELGEAGYAALRAALEKIAERR